MLEFALLLEAHVIRRMTIVGVMLAIAAGCGRSEQQRQAEEAAQQIQQGAETIQRAAEQAAQGGSEQMAQGLQQMAQGFQQLAQGQANPVDFEVLKGVLPQVSGWTQSGARGEQVSMPIKMSKAEAQYSSGDARVELEITDSALNQLLLAPFSMILASGYSERSDDGFKRAAKVGGHPGLEEWNSRSHRGEVTAVVGNRFIVQGTGHGVEDLAAVRRIVEAVDLSKLASLK